MSCRQDRTCSLLRRASLGFLLAVRRIVLPTLLSTLLCLAGVTQAQDDLPAVTITGVRINHDSVRIYFMGVPGAADYRAYNVADPGKVKYAGRVHLFAGDRSHWKTDGAGNPVVPYETEPNSGGKTQPQRIDVPAVEIEYNGLSPGVPVSLIVEAVDAAGPIPPGALYDIRNSPLYPDYDPMAMLGSNQGMTYDDRLSTNGTGDLDNDPQPIARSRAFRITPTGRPALPSIESATQVAFDDFSAGTIEVVNPPDYQNSRADYRMRSALEWDVNVRNADVIHSSAFIMNRHFMDVLFDGGTPGTNNPLHTAHGLLAVSPRQTADFSGGRILHLTMEVDAHLSGRRWIAFNLSPDSDPLTNWYNSQGEINRSDQALFVEFFDKVATTLFIGPTSDTDRNPKGIAITGAAGQALHYVMRPQPDHQRGHGIDSRSRFDLFVSQNHFAIYEDGIQACEYDVPGEGLPFTRAKVYFSHYLYHTANEYNDLRRYSPWESYWIDTVPWSDERHWDNMGFEVLPAETDWAALPDLVQPPDLEPPLFDGQVEA